MSSDRDLTIQDQMPDRPERRQCPRCGLWFAFWLEYVDHAWHEKP